MSNVSTTTAAIYQAVLDSLNSSGECGVLPPAPPGKSAYEVAVDNGFVGSEKQWLDSLTLEQENEIARLEARIVANENIFNDYSKAASRLVGTNTGNVVEVRSFGIGENSLSSRTPIQLGSELPQTGFFKVSPDDLKEGHPTAMSGPVWSWAPTGLGASVKGILSPSGSNSDFYCYSWYGSNRALNRAGKIYTELNTTKDSRSNLLLASGDSIPSTSAASKLVGKERGEIALNGEFGVGVFKDGRGRLDTTPKSLEGTGLTSYFSNATQLGLAGGAYVYYGVINLAPWALGQPETYCRMLIRHGNLYLQFVQGVGDSAIWGENTLKVYTTGNTTKEEGTGYIVASSPVLKMQHDSFEKVHEAEQLDIEVNNIKTGVYEITGTTGLREDDGWNLKPPKDVNGNVLCICEATEKNGVITLKTYKKKFDFETVSIVADYEQPTDIPEGATVMLRFNDLPEEQRVVPESVEDPTVDEAEGPEVAEEPVLDDSEEPVEDPEAIEDANPEVVEEDVPVEEDPKD